jgi:hypothetical protein
MILRRFAARRPVAILALLSLLSFLAGCARPPAAIGTPAPISVTVPGFAFDTDMFTFPNEIRARNPGVPDLVGPFVLARATGAPVLPAFCVLRPDRRYAITLGEPIRVTAGGERQALARWVVVPEEAIRRHPGPWFNFFDVWSGVPAR